MCCTEAERYIAWTRRLDSVAIKGLAVERGDYEAINP